MPFRCLTEHLVAVQAPLEAGRRIRKTFAKRDYLARYDPGPIEQGTRNIPEFILRNRLKGIQCRKHKNVCDQHCAKGPRGNPKKYLYERATRKLEAIFPILTRKGPKNLSRLPSLESSKAKNVRVHTNVFLGLRGEV